MSKLPRVRPEEVGIDPTGIERFLLHIQELNTNLHSFMLLRYGQVAAEAYARPFHADLLHPIYSVSKSVTSAAVGIAIAEGRFSLDDRVVDLFPDKLHGEVHPFTAEMKIRHLLSMQTVHRSSTNTKVDDWVALFLNTPPAHPPGTVFAYDTTATHTLCAAIQRTTGMTLHDYLRPRLFDPIGIGDIEWEACPMGINKGGGGIRCTTEDMARFGQLYLQDGVWEGRRILPEGWVSQSTVKVVDNSNASAQLDGRQGYGYQFWLGRHNSYCAFGMGGQFILVVPDVQIVFVTTANTLQNRDEHQFILDSFWQWIYPALSDHARESDEAANASMLQRLSDFQVHLAYGAATHRDLPEILRSQTSQRYKLLDNETGIVSCEFIWGEICKLVFVYEQQQTAVSCSFAIGNSVHTPDPFFNTSSAAIAGWVDERTLILQIHSLEQLQMFSLTCCFSEDRVVIQIKSVGAMQASHLEGEFVGYRS